MRIVADRPVRGVTRPHTFRIGSLTIGLPVVEMTNPTPPSRTPLRWARLG